MTAGYSKKSLVEKFGIKRGFKIAILNSPRGFGKTLGKLPSDVQAIHPLAGSLDCVHLFATQKIALVKAFPRLKKSVVPSGMVWISWPKGSSQMETDLNETIVRKTGLENGMVDVKVCAVDEDWSGLKFVLRLKDRY